MFQKPGQGQSLVSHSGSLLVGKNGQKPFGGRPQGFLGVALLIGRGGTLIGLLHRGPWVFPCSIDHPDARP